MGSFLIKAGHVVDPANQMDGEADVFIENFAPGTIERLGFSYEAVRALNPGIIYAQIKGFAADSPYARHLAFDMIAQAMGGIMSITGEEGGKPLKPGPTLGDTGTAISCAATILALAASHPRGSAPPGRGGSAQLRDWINHIEKREPVEVRVSRVDCLKTMLSHQDGSVRIKHDVAAQTRHLRKNSGGDLAVPVRLHQNPQARRSKQCVQKAPRLQ